MVLEYNHLMSKEFKNVLVGQQIKNLKEMNDEKFKKIELLERKQAHLKVLLEETYFLAQKSNSAEVIKKIEEMLRLVLE